jgi:hypothetical protein
MTNEVIHERYLPFSKEHLLRHFVGAADDQRHLRYYEQSARRYSKHMHERVGKTTPLSLADMRLARQIEKDERFWVVACLMKYFHEADRVDRLSLLLESAFDSSTPPIDIPTWDKCVEGNLHLFFEVDLPSPKSYCEALRSDRVKEHLIPYVREAASRTSARVLEGPTQVDAMLVNADNGFAVLFEAKVLSDTSCHVSFDVTRNQIARNVDVMLDQPKGLPNHVGALTLDIHRHAVNSRRPDRTLFVLLTPEIFKRRPHSRLYGWLMNAYRSHPTDLADDLSHRQRTDWADVSRRLGWATWEEANRLVPGSCGWLTG